MRRVPASYGSSNSYLGGKPKVVWHSTESDPGSIEGNLRYAESVGYGPHIWWDPSTGEIVQVLPVTTPATALADPAGRGINRMGSVVVQVEVIGRAAKGPLSHGPLKGVGRLREFFRSLGVPEVFPAGVPVGAVAGDRSVFGPKSSGGHYTHSQIPDNTHVDPGLIRKSLLFPVEDELTKSDLAAIEAIIVRVVDERVRRLNADLFPRDATDDRSLRQVVKAIEADVEAIKSKVG